MANSPKPSLIVTQESTSGLNKKFIHVPTGIEMTRGQVADLIEQGNLPGYHVMHVNQGDKVLRIPRSNPDSSKKNNLD